MKRRMTSKFDTAAGFEEVQKMKDRVVPLQIDGKLPGMLLEKSEL